MDSISSLSQLYSMSCKSFPLGPESLSPPWSLVRSEGFPTSLLPRLSGSILSVGTWGISPFAYPITDHVPLFPFLSPFPPKPSGRPHPAATNAIVCPNRSYSHPPPLKFSRYNLLARDGPQTGRRLRRAPACLPVTLSPWPAQHRHFPVLCHQPGGQERCGNLSPLGVARQRSRSSKPIQTVTRRRHHTHSFRLSGVSSRVQGDTHPRTTGQVPTTSPEWHKRSRLSRRNTVNAGWTRAIQKMKVGRSGENRPPLSERTRTRESVNN